jgi:uncharacterized protein (UPF0332 family)
LANPRELLDVARLLVLRSRPSDAALRRAVSTTYYALFHTVAGEAATRFSDHTAPSLSYNLVYRALDHARIRNVLREASRPRLSDTFRTILARDATSENLRKFAAGFLRMQALRHLADYDPSTAFMLHDVVDLIDEAEGAVATFQNIDDTERSGVISLMLFGGRI